MNKRLAISLAAFVGWMLITFVGGQIHTGEAPLLEVVTRGLGWHFLLAVVFVLALVVWQQWRGVSLNKLASGRSLLLTWLIVHGLWDFATFGIAAARSGEAQPGSGRGRMTLMYFLPTLLVLPNALYGLWLMRRIGQTHALADL